MVTNRDDAGLDLIFGALAHPARRAILDRLSHGELTVGELARPFALTRPAISKHLDVLERARLVERIPEGRQNRCRFVGSPLAEAARYVLGYARYWTDQFDALECHFQQQIPEAPE